MIEQHFVTFKSPGTFVHEETTLPIEEWKASLAVDMAHGIVERHGSTPFGFVFTTRRREDTELDSKVVATSGLYFLGGEILTLADVKARDDDSDRILISNMERNHIGRVIENRNSWRSTHEMGDEDTVVQFVPKQK